MYCVIECRSLIFYDLSRPERCQNERHSARLNISFRDLGIDRVNNQTRQMCSYHIFHAQMNQSIHPLSHLARSQIRSDRRGTIVPYPSYKPQRHCSLLLSSRWSGYHVALLLPDSTREAHHPDREA
jgi:hypothetical protein